MVYSGDAEILKHSLIESGITPESFNQIALLANPNKLIINELRNELEIQKQNNECISYYIKHEQTSLEKKEAAKSNGKLNCLTPEEEIAFDKIPDALNYAEYLIRNRLPNK